MVDLLKAFGRGVLYIICFPFFIVALAIFAVIGLLAFLFQIIKSIIYFFTGQRFFPELPEDKELRLMKEAEEAKNNPAPQPVNNTANPVPESLVFQEVLSEEDFEEEPTPAMVFPTPTPTKTVEEACFEEPKSEAQPEEDSILLAREKKDEEDGSGEPEMPVSSSSEEKAEFTDEDNDALEDLLNPVNEEEEEEELEEYHPKGTDDSELLDDNDDDSGSTGVNIKFDD